MRAEFERISHDCGGCLEVLDVAEVFEGLPRVPGPTNVVSIVAIQRGTTDPDRFVLLSGDLDSRVSDIMNAVDSSPGANDNASGVAAVLEAARVLSARRFRGSIVYAALSGEENGLLGGQTVAALAAARGWRMTGVINNDMIGNVDGGDGIRDTTTVRVFSEGTSPTETDSARKARRATGGEVDGVSRQLARYIKAIGDRYLPSLDVWLDLPSRPFRARGAPSSVRRPGIPRGPADGGPRELRAGSTRTSGWRVAWHTGTSSRGWTSTTRER